MPQVTSKPPSQDVAPDTPGERSSPPAGTPSLFREFYERRYMLVVAIGGNSFFYAQAFFIFSDQSAKDVSAIANCIAAWALMSWLVYGIVIRNRILVVANIIGILGILLILLGIAMYR